MGTQGNALKFFLDRFSKGMDGEQGARPRNVYELWGNLFPQLYVNQRTGQPIEPRNLKAQASKYAAKSRAELAALLLANDARADVPPAQKLAERVRDIVAGGAQDDLAPIPCEVLCQFYDAWTGRPEAFEPELLHYHGLGFVYDLRFRAEYLERLEQDFAQASKADHALLRMELTALDRLLAEPGTSAERARELFVDSVSLYVAAAVGGPAPYATVLGVDVYGKTAIAQPQAAPSVARDARAQLVAVVMRDGSGRHCYTAERTPVRIDATREARIGRDAQWAAADGAVPVTTALQTASRCHATVRHRDGQWVVADVGADGAGSSYGTLLLRASGGREYLWGGEAQLRDGDVVCVAPSYLAEDHYEPVVGRSDCCLRFELL